MGNRLDATLLVDDSSRLRPYRIRFDSVSDGIRMNGKDIGAFFAAVQCQYRLSPTEIREEIASVYIDGKYLNGHRSPSANFFPMNYLHGRLYEDPEAMKRYISAVRDSHCDSNASLEIFPAMLNGNGHSNGGSRGVHASTVSYVTHPSPDELERLPPGQYVPEKRSRAQHPINLDSQDDFIPIFPPENGEDAVITFAVGNDQLETSRSFTTRAPVHLEITLRGVNYLRENRSNVEVIGRDEEGQIQYHGLVRIEKRNFSRYVYKNLPVGLTYEVVAQAGIQKGDPDEFSIGLRVMPAQPRPARASPMSAIRSSER